MTLNQVIQEIKGIAERHKQIRHFYFGEPVDWTAQADLTYPACLVVLNDGSITPTEIEMPFSLYLSDRVFQTEESVNQDKAVAANSLEVQSDMLQVATDFLAQLNHPDYDWIVSTSSAPFSMYSDTPINEDVVAGCRLDFTLRVPTELNRCQIPFED